MGGRLNCEGLCFSSGRGVAMRKGYRVEWLDVTACVLEAVCGLLEGQLEEG